MLPISCLNRTHAKGGPVPCAKGPEHLPQHIHRVSFALKLRPISISAALTRCDAGASAAGELVRIRAKTTSSTTAEDCNCVRGRRNRSTRNSHCSAACGKSWFRKDWREGRGKRATCPGFHENREYVHWCGENRSARESGTEKQAGRQRGRAIPVPVRRMRSGDAASLPVAGRKKKWKRREELEKRWRS